MLEIQAVVVVGIEPHYIALVGLELTVKIRLALNRAACLCLKCWVSKGKAVTHGRVQDYFLLSVHRRKLTSSTSVSEIPVGFFFLLQVFFES